MTLIAIGIYPPYIPGQTSKESSNRMGKLPSVDLGFRYDIRGGGGCHIPHNIASLHASSFGYIGLQSLSSPGWPLSQGPTYAKQELGVVE